MFILRYIQTYSQHLFDEKLNIWEGELRERMICILQTKQFILRDLRNNQKMWRLHYCDVADTFE